MSDLQAKRIAEQNVEAILSSHRVELNKQPTLKLAALNNPASIGRHLASLIPKSPGTYGKIIGAVHSSAALKKM